MTEIRLTNTMTHRKEVLRPLDPSNVRMYVCGPTVYDRAHLGNARPAVVFDVLFRLLRHVYGRGNVTYVRNITDVDDKIIDRAHERGVGIDDLTRQTTDWYREDMADLGVLAPTHEPRATEHVDDMIAMIRTLVERKHAYEAEGHVLFSVASDPDYGTLSGRSTDDMIAGARVEVAPYKRDPMDFVLWKPSTGDQPGWDSPWGRGRPGWHIECSAMARDLLGPAFDIHGGGTDLMFPHHENEIAQSNCAGDRFATIWMHNEMLQVEGRKMSKSLGNFFTVRDLLDQGRPGEVIRLVFLGTHYRGPMDWTERKVREAEATLRKWRRLTAGVKPGAVSKAAVAALADDLNTHGAIAELHRLAAAEEAAALAASARLLGLLTEELGGWDQAPDSGETGALIEAILADRLAAREARDFARADALRDGIAAAGVRVKDTPEGATWELTPDFDPAKLEALR
jgi:cysteinyl-tRNA synthetase